MPLRHAGEPRQPAEVWRLFGRLCLPAWDMDFMRRVLWKKLPIGDWMRPGVGSYAPSAINSRITNMFYEVAGFRLLHLTLLAKLLVWSGGRGVVRN